MVPQSFHLKIVNLLQNLVRQNIKPVIKMSPLIAKELNVLDDEGITGLGLCRIFRAVRIKANCFVVSYAVTERLDNLKFVVDSPLPKSFCPAGEYLKDGLTAKTERDPVEKICPEPKSHRRYNAIICIFS